MPWTDYIERALATVLYHKRGNDAALLTRHEVFKDIPRTIQITSIVPDGKLGSEHIKTSGNLFPPLSVRFSTLLASSLVEKICRC